MTQITQIGKLPTEPMRSAFDGARTALSARTNGEKRMDIARMWDNKPDRSSPSAVNIRAQDFLTWTRGQSCPRSNNASADAMKFTKRSHSDLGHLRPVAGDSCHLCEICA